MGTPSEIKKVYGDIVGCRTYQRFLRDEGRRESWDEAVSRYGAYLEPIVPDNLKPLFSEAVEAIRNKEVMPSMRALWTAGEALDNDQVAGYNCSFIPIIDFKCYSELMYLLMNGVGVGISVERQYICKLPVINDDWVEGRTYVVSDSKEGWSETYLKLLNDWANGVDSNWDISQVRPKGSIIKKFGGRASGGGVLDELFTFSKNIFVENKGEKLTSDLLADLACKTAEVVLCGGVRRSAIIVFSNLSDLRMRNYKIGDFYRIHPHRCLANISAVYDGRPDSIVMLEEMLSLIKSNAGERGIVNIGTYKDKDMRMNPCGERILKPFQFCNLSEVVITSGITVEELSKRVKYATLLGTIQASLTRFNHDILREEWFTNTTEDALLGVSFTGTANIDWNKDLLNLLKSIAETNNEIFAKEIGVKKAAGITCLKPSGCQTPDTLVLSSEGVLTLDELGDVEGKTWQDIDLEVSQENNEAKATKFFVNGKALVKKLKMKSGVTLTSTLNHQYRVLENNKYVWKASDSIEEGTIIPYKVGDYEGGKYQKLVQVGMPYYNCNKITFPEYLDEEFAFFLGMYVGDGSNHAKSIRIAGNNYNKLESLNRIKSMFKDKFGLDTSLYERTKCERNVDLNINSTWFLAFMRANDLMKKDTYNISIPLLIRKSPKSVLQSFVDGYIAADGHIASDGSGRIIICTVSKRMAEEMVVVWRALGKYAKLSEQPPTKTSWGEAMRYRIETNKGREGDLKKNTQNKGFIWKTVELLDSLGLTNLFPDVVESIEYGEEDTYDIEVPQNNTYIANSYVSHNSVSQLVGTSAGIHPEYAEFFIRRLRIAALDPLCTMLREQGVPHNKEVGEEDKEVPTSYVFDFPIKGSAKRMRKNETALDQLEIYKLFKEHWCDERGNPSCTIYVRKHEWLQVIDWVYSNFDIVGGVSFLPYDNGVYKLAPYEEITEEKFNELCKNFPEIDLSKLPEYEKDDYTVGAKELACTGGSCELV